MRVALALISTQKANASHGLTVNSLKEPLGLFQAVANSVGREGVWAQIRALAWRQNDSAGKAAERQQAIFLTPAVQKGGVKSQMAINML